MRKESAELDHLGAHLLVAGDDSESSKIAAICQSLGISYEQFEALEQQHSLDRNLLLRSWNSEQGVGRFLNWMQIDYSLERLLHGILLQRSVLNRGIPLEDRTQLRKAFATLGFTQGLNFVLARSLHTCVLVLLGYQIYSGRTYNPVTMYREADAIAVTDISHALLDKDASRILYSVLATLCAWTVVKSATYAYLTPADPDKAVADALKAIEAVPNNATYNWSRWLLPRPPLDRHINLLERLIVWDARLSDGSRLAAFKGLTEIIETRAGYSAIAALHAIAKIAKGVSLRQFNLVSEQQKSSMLAIKLLAASFVEEQKRSESLAESLKQPFRKMYAAYLFWALGLSESKAQRLGFLGFKLTKLTLIALFMKSLIEGYIDFKNCPDKPYSFATGAPAFAGDFSQSCFDATISSFGKYPGQDVSYLTNLIADFKGRLNNPLQLDLSGKSLYGAEIAEIVRALQNLGIEIDELNISGNILNESRDIEALMPLIRGIKHLNASSCYIGEDRSDGDSSITFGEQLPMLVDLEVLDISNNSIGEQETNGSILVAAAFKYLTKLRKLIAVNNELGSNGHLEEVLRLPLSLQHLDLSNCFFGFPPQDNLIPVLESLANLSQLTYLDLSSNSFSRGNYSVVLARSLGQLPNLEVLILNTCDLGDAPNVLPMVTSIGGLAKLRYLGLSSNYFIEDSAWLQFAASLKKLRWLETLNIESNFLGYNRTQGVEAFIEVLGSLESLVNFDVSSNQLGKLGDNTVNAIVSNFFKLSHLRQVNLDRNGLSFNETKAVNSALQALGLSSRVGITIIREQDVDDFFASLSPNIRSLDLSSALSEASVEAWVRFATHLRLQTQLVSLDLSNNHIFEIGESEIDLLLNALGALTNLEYLKLSDIFYINNPPFYDQFIRSLASLVNLEDLNLFGVWGGRAVNQSLNANFFAALGGMKKLRKLELGWYEIGFNNGNYEFAQQLQNLTQLEYLGLSNTCVGCVDDGGHGMSLLFEAIKNLKKLKVLDLSGNEIGRYRVLDSQIIANYLNQTYALTSLDLGYNCIGFNHTKGMSFIFDVVPRLTNLSWLSVPNTISGVNWTGNFEAFAARTTQGLQEKCQAELCFSSGIIPNQAPLELVLTGDWGFGRCQVGQKITALERPAELSFVAAPAETKWSATQPELIPLFMLLMLCVYAFKKISECFVARSEEPQRARVSVLG